MAAFVLLGVRLVLAATKCKRGLLHCNLALLSDFKLCLVLLAFELTLNLAHATR